MINSWHEIQTAIPQRASTRIEYFSVLTSLGMNKVWDCYLSTRLKSDEKKCANLNQALARDIFLLFVHKDSEVESSYRAIVEHWNKVK
jgi:hypothetical protein